MSAPEVLVLVASPEKGTSLPIFVEVAEVNGRWTVKMRGVVVAFATWDTREGAICAAMGFRS